MSRRKGQNPEVRVGKRADGTKYYFFQYWIDVARQDERKRLTEVIGSVKQMTRSEAERKKLEFISKLQVNSNDYLIPSSQTFADAVRHYREVFAPRMLRDSTLDVADGRIKNHLEADWKDVPIEHITTDSMNEWAWKKRQAGVSWGTIKDALRTMQRVLSSFSKDGRPPFSQHGLAIPERDKLQMKIRSRQKPSLSWAQAKQLAEQVRKLDGLGEGRSKQYATIFLLASGAGLRCSDVFALKINDINFKAGTIRVDESSDQRSRGRIGPAKNSAAYRMVLHADHEGKEALRALRAFIGASPHNPTDLVFHSEGERPLLETTVLRDGLYPSLKALGLKQCGLHAFRRGCNRRWELAGVSGAVIRQQIGHSSQRMTELYTGEIPLDQVEAQFSSKTGTKIVVLENMENEAVA